MSLATLLAFMLVSAAQVATPGPSTMFLLDNAIMYGPRRAVATLSGDLAAIVILASLSAAGAGALLAANAALFAALRLAGAVYLVWLGARYFLAARKDTAVAGARPDRQAAFRLWLRSFGVGISNPKAILFFAALFPQFLPPGPNHALLAGLVAAFVLTKLAVLGGYALAARRLKKVFARHGNAELGRRLTGAVFILFGCVMACSVLA